MFFNDKEETFKQKPETRIEKIKIKPVEKTETVEENIEKPRTIEESKYNHTLDKDLFTSVKKQKPGMVSAKRW